MIILLKEGMKRLLKKWYPGLLVYMVREAKDKKHYVNVTMDDMSQLLGILYWNTCNMRWGIRKNFQSREGEKSKLTVTVIAGIF